MDSKVMIRCWAWNGIQNGWKAHALELGVESRERVADDLCVRADCFARLGFVEQAERDRYVAGRLRRHRAAIDRVEAAELWRYHSLRFVHRREVTVGFMRTNAAQIASVEASAKPTQGRQRGGRSARGKRLAYGSLERGLVGIRTRPVSVAVDA